ncbi:MAG: hypothetical protein HYS26_01955 [Candidatus Kaiserbacteria bacterium]|nr:MAG: hypothetical protein HYS26_01955 [Candidatus Kaiserbacteria bacterium]
MNRTYVLGGAVALVLVILFLWTQAAGDFVGQDVRLALFNTGETKKGLLYIPTRRDAEGAAVEFFVDVNADGTFAPEEKVGGSASMRGLKGKSVGVPVSFTSAPEAGSRVKIAFENDSYIRTIAEVAVESEDLLELEKVTDPENAMKGLFYGVAFAKEPATEAGRITPDIGQRIAECAPTAAANSIISLAEDHGQSDKLPADADLIDQLKGDMDWTPENGVLPDDFVEGKNRWAATHGLPIQTTKVGDQHGRTTIEALLDGLAEGGAAEMRIKFADARGKATGGHMVTVTGVRVVGDQTFVEVADPRTPEGYDTYEVEGNTLKDYPYEGIAVISWGFVQRWVEPTGTQLDPMTDAEVEGIRAAVGVKEKIKVIVVLGRKIPLSQVHVGKGSDCTEGGKEMPHYHANDGSATALDGTVVQDNDGCGYGMVKNIPVEDAEIP